MSEPGRVKIVSLGDARAVAQAVSEGRTPPRSVPSWGGPRALPSPAEAALALRSGGSCEVCGTTEEKERYEAGRGGAVGLVPHRERPGEYVVVCPRCGDAHDDQLHVQALSAQARMSSPGFR